MHPEPPVPITLDPHSIISAYTNEQLRLVIRGLVSLDNLSVTLQRQAPGRQKILPSQQIRLEDQYLYPLLKGVATLTSSQQQ